MFKIHVFSAIKESWTLTGGEILKKVDLVQNSHFDLVCLSIIIFLKENQATCQTGKAGGKTRRFVGQVELGEQDGLNVKKLK